MAQPLDTLLAELEQFGKTNDQTTTERPRRMLNISRDTGALWRCWSARHWPGGCSRSVRPTATRPSGSPARRRRLAGRVTTIERSDYKVELAKAAFTRSGLAGSIALVQDDAGRVLQRSADGAFDLIFLDSERPEYAGWWPDLKRVLRPGGLLVVDNATSHQAEMAPFVTLVSADAGFVTSLVPVGNGEFLAVKAAQGRSDRP